MNNIPYEQIPFMSPDSTRKFLNTNKKLFDNYTKKNYSETDLNGITNTGTVENFGAEILMESRKLLNERVEHFKDIYPSDFKFYFNMSWSPLTPTIKQETVVQCILKNDVLLSDHSYKIIFNDVDIEYFMRSQSSSDPEVKKCKFYIANDVHLLMDEDTDIELVKENDIYYPCFFYNKFTKDYCEYDEENKTLTVEIYPEVMIDLPWIWMSFKSNIDSDMYPFRLLGNSDMELHDLISLGRDGHNMIYGYPHIYGEDNIPMFDESLISDENRWYLKCFPNNDFNEFTQDIDRQLNWRVPVIQIQYCYGPSIGNNLFTYNIFVRENKNTSLLLYNKTAWQFRNAQEGDTDYDDTGFNNPVYAYIELSQFDINGEEDPILKPGFIASQEYYKNERDIDLLIEQDSRSGIHIDASSEYSDNGIPKKNGVIHELGDFDGLPDYFKYNLDKTIHRIHTEAYAIKQKTNIKQTSIQRGTAGLIFDTAIPQTEGNFILDGLTICIRYDYASGRTFRTLHESEDKNNVLSEIVYIDKENVGCSSEAKYLNNSKFVYHGNRVFSLGKTGLDPDKEIARVYHISNDIAEYKNNEQLEENKRIPGRAIARISDIPTSFLQLTHIKGISPIIVIDEDYVRTECEYKKSDKNNLWNKIYPDFLNYNGQYIFENPEDLAVKLTANYIRENYSSWVNLNGSIDIYKEQDKYTIEVINEGTGYAESDKVKFSIGGLDVQLLVTDVLTNGKLNGVDVILDEYGVVDKSLFKTQITEYDLASVKGAGKGARIALIINDNKWDSFHKSKGSVLNNYDALVRDSYNNLIIYRFSPNKNEWVKYQQLTGVDTDINPYDDENIVPQTKRSTKSVFIHNMLNNDIVNTPSFIEKHEAYNVSITKEQIISGEDLSDIIDYGNIGRLHGYYIFLYDESSDKVVAYVESIDNSCFNETLLPRFNKVNMTNVINYSNQLRILSVKNNSQVIPYIYNPNKTYRDSYVTGDYEFLGNNLISDLFTNDIVSDYSLLANVYNYNIYSFKEINELREELSNISRTALVELIEKDLDNPNILEYEGTSYAYSKDELINYIIQRTYFDPSYIHAIPEILRRIHEVTEQSVGGKRLPVGEQQTGWFEWLTNYIRHDITIDGYQNTMDQLKIFKIDSSVIFDNSFRIFDEFDKDISNNCILVYDNSLFIFSNNKWINIRR